MVNPNPTLCPGLTSTVKQLWVLIVRTVRSQRTVRVTPWSFSDVHRGLFMQMSCSKPSGASAAFGAEWEQAYDGCRTLL
jgi:hypothetical protein